MQANNVKLLSTGSSIFEMLKAKSKHLISDSMSFAVFISIIAQSVLFLGIVQNDGASKISFTMTDLANSNIKIIVLQSLIIISFSFLFSKYIRLTYLLIINLLFSLLLVGDLWYFRGFQDFLSLNTLGETQNLSNLMLEISTMPRKVDLIFLVDNLIILYLSVFSRKRYRALKRQKSIFSILFTASIFIMYSMHISPAHQYVPILTMKNLTPLGYHFYDALLYAEDVDLHILSEKEKTQINQWLAYKNENLADNEYSGMLKGNNVLFIQVESLENFVINQKYNGQTITPNLNKLLSNSLYFSNFYSQINNGNSGDADLMANASVLPLRRGSTFFRYPNNQYNTLGKLLQAENYNTQSMHASSGVIWNVSQALKNFGFNKSFDMNSFENADIWGMGVTDKSFFSYVSDSLEKETDPFYYYTVTVSSHMPFEIRDDMKSLNLSQNFNDTIMGKYLQSIHYADEQIGNFINELDKKGILDNTMIVIYGDHEGVHKYYNDQLQSINEDQSWWNNNSKIPFIIYNKNIKGKEITTAGGEVDILPTTAYLLGIDKSKYENTSMGRNLLNTEKSYAILNDGTIIGKENLSQEDIDHISKSFDIADLIIQANYFNKKSAAANK